MKNCIDIPISHSAICAGNVTNSIYPTREIAFANCVTVFSLAVPRTKNVLGMEDCYE